LKTLREVMEIQSAHWSCLKGLNTRLPDSLDDLIKMRTPVKDGKKGTPPKSSYVPSEYGRNAADSPHVTTLSSSLAAGRGSPGAGIVDSKKERADNNGKELDEVSSRLAAATIASGGDYVPPEYGSPAARSATVDTIRQSSTSAKCNVTPAPKQTTNH